MFHYDNLSTLPAGNYACFKIWDPDDRDRDRDRDRDVNCVSDSYKPFFKFIFIVRFRS